MNFDTAIYYDIENLIGGYGANVEDIHKLSLKKILASIKSLKLVGEIAVQKAYANWSDARLSSLRKELVELGIEPIQMFGFGKGSYKNASDIHLAIDVIECALTKSFLKRFVIVSGDGGFSTLAKKLHEHNRVVIGCAYEKAANQVFKSVCDEFLWLPHPSDEARKETNPSTSLPSPKQIQTAANKPAKPAQNSTSKVAAKVETNGANGEKPKSTDPLLKKFFATLDKKALNGAGSMLTGAKLAFLILLSLKEVQEKLRDKGFGISRVSQALTHSVPGFSVQGCGFPKLVDLVRHLVHGQPVDLLHLPPSDFRLVVKGKKLDHFQKVESLVVPPELHSAEFYLKLLPQGVPILRLPAPGILQKVLRKMELDEFSKFTLPREEFLHRVVAITGENELDVKGILITLSNLGFIRKDASEENPQCIWQTMSEESSQVIFNKVQEVVKEKLVKVLGRFDKSIVHKMFHAKAQPATSDAIPTEAEVISVEVVTDHREAVVA